MISQTAQELMDKLKEDALANQSLEAEVPAAPAAPAGPSDADRLYEAQTAGNKQQYMSQLLRSFQNMLQSSAPNSGFRADHGMSDAMSKQADQMPANVKDQLNMEARARQESQNKEQMAIKNKMESEDHANRMKESSMRQDDFQLKLAKANIDFQDMEANRDPNSPQSKIAQDRVLEVRAKMGQPLNEASVRQNTGEQLFKTFDFLKEDLVNHYKLKKDMMDRQDKISAQDKDLAYKEKALSEQITSRKDIATMNAEARAAAAEEKKSQKVSEQDHKDALKLQDTLDKGWAARGGAAGQIQQKINAAEAAEALLEQGRFQQGGLDSRQIEELSQATARLIGGGGTVASARVEALVPHTLLGRAQTLKEWISSKPQGQEMQEFTTRLEETIQREKDLAFQQRKKYQQQSLAAHARLKKSNPEIYNEILASKGLSEDSKKEEKSPDSGPYGDTTTMDGKTYKWNPAVGKYQLIGQ